MMMDHRLIQKEIHDFEANGDPMGGFDLVVECTCGWDDFGYGKTISEATAEAKHQFAVHLAMTKDWVAV